VKTEQTEVLIVGGGGAGLTASMLLASYGVETLLVNDRPTTSTLPKAHMLNQRTMEVFDEVGLAAAVYEHGTPAAQMAATGWYSGVVAPHTDHFRLIGKIEAWGAGYEDPEYVAASPRRSANLPQLNLEPLMRERAERMAGADRVRFGHELLSFDQDADGVRALVRDGDGEYAVEARYLIAADAGRTVGPALGVELVGEPPTVQMVTLFISADLSSWAREDDVVSWHLITPEMDSTLESGTLLAAGPERWGGRSEQWYFHLMYPLDDPAAFDDEAVVGRMRTVLGLPEVDIEVHVINRWTIYRSLADRFRVENVFLAGDAAHRNPPMGGLGLNSAIGDVHNLCWKLAAALRGQGGERLLASYEAERRPFCDLVIRRAFENSRRSEGLHEAIGMSPELSREENWRALTGLWEDADAAAEERRRRVRGILQRQSMDFRDLNIEVGLPYGASPALVGGGEPGPEPVDPIRVYQPTTLPGHPLPHAWVEDGRRRASLRDLCAGTWLLVCGEEAGDWRQAGLRLARERGLPLAAIEVGHAAGDWFDVRCAWLRQRQVGPAGCVLARPDRFVAWRSPEGGGDPGATLAGVLDLMLGV
jgi:2,4-dichlorophenol 6-monooxygenase